MSRMLTPLRRFAAAFFKHDIALRREKGAMHLVLAERPAAAHARPPTRGEASRRKEQTELAQTRVELAALLNELPETRSTMRHLVFVERAIAKRGLKVLHKLPLDVLQRAHEQLENLVTNWSPVGLATLRSKMAVAIIDREHMDIHAETDAYRTAAVLDPPHPVRVYASAPVQPPEFDDDAALAAAYAALGNLSPAEAPVQMQGELGSASARELMKPEARESEPLPEIRIRVLQP